MSDLLPDGDLPNSAAQPHPESITLDDLDTNLVDHETQAALDAVLAHAAASAPDQHSLNPDDPMTMDEEAARALASLDVPQILDHDQQGFHLVGGTQDQEQEQEQDDITLSSSNIDPSLGSTNTHVQADQIVVKTEAEDASYDNAAALRRQNGFGMNLHGHGHQMGVGGMNLGGGFDMSSSRGMGPDHGGSDRFFMVRGLSPGNMGMGSNMSGGIGMGGSGPRRDGGGLVDVTSQTSSERYAGRKRKASGSGSGSGPGGAGAEEGDEGEGEGEEGYIGGQGNGRGTNDPSGYPHSPHSHPSEANASNPAAPSFQVPAPPTTRSRKNANANANTSAAGPAPNKRNKRGAQQTNPAGPDSNLNPNATSSATSGNPNNDGTNQVGDGMQITGANAGVEPWWNNQVWDEGRQDGGAGPGSGARGGLGAGGSYGGAGMGQHNAGYTGDSPATGTSAGSASYMPTGGVYGTDPSYNQWAATPSSNDHNNPGDLNVDSDMWKSYYGGGGDGSGSGVGGGGGIGGSSGNVGVNTENLEQYLLEPMSNSGTLGATLADPNAGGRGHSPDDDDRRDSASSSGSRSESGRIRTRSGIPDDLRDSLSNQPYSRSPELRVSHKLAERKRRREMKDLFDELRDCLPNDRAMKASKWEILSKSVDFIQNMKKHNESMGRELEVLRRENERMRLESATGGSGGNGQNTLNGMTGGSGNGNGNGNPHGMGGQAGGQGGPFGGRGQHQQQYPMSVPPTPSPSSNSNNLPPGGFVPPLQVQPRTSPFSASATPPTAV